MEEESYVINVCIFKINFHNVDTEHTFKIRSTYVNCVYSLLTSVFVKWNLDLNLWP